MLMLFVTCFFADFAEFNCSLKLTCFELVWHICGFFVSIIDFRDDFVDLLCALLPPRINS